MNQKPLNQSYPFTSTSPLISYYMSDSIPNYEELISNNIKHMKFTEPKLNPEQKKDIDYSTQIESAIKKHHNFIIPAISIQLNPDHNSEQCIEFQIDNLKELFSLFGEIKFIDINANSSKAYILFKYYFSALFAFDTISQILSKSKSKDQIFIKLVSESNNNKNDNENPQQSSLKLHLNTNCKAYIPKAFKNSVIGAGCNENKGKENYNSNSHSNVPCNYDYNNDNSLDNRIQFTTCSSREYLFKYVTNYNIQIENEAEFQVTKRIIGNNGFKLKKIIYDSCIAFNDYSTKVRLRGRGSGYKEGLENKESEEPLQLCVSSLNYNTYINCCKLLEVFLDNLYAEYYSFLMRKAKREGKEQSNYGNDNNSDGIRIGTVLLLSIMKHDFIVNRYPNN